MRSGWAAMGKFWSSKARYSCKRSVLLTKVCEAGVFGLLAITPYTKQLHALTTIVCKYLRVLEQGAAFVHADGAAMPTRNYYHDEPDVHDG